MIIITTTMLTHASLTRRVHRKAEVARTFAITEGDARPYRLFTRLGTAGPAPRGCCGLLSRSPFSIYRDDIKARVSACLDTECTLLSVRNRLPSLVRKLAGARKRRPFLRHSLRYYFRTGLPFALSARSLGGNASSRPRLGQGLDLHGPISGGDDTAWKNISRVSP